jgi:mono/diheme cytochrome c family protein
LHFERHRSDVSRASRGYGGKTVVTQAANTTGRLLASNCFQCHGTGGYGGFDRIRGSEADEVLEYLTKSAPSNIMAAHAQGYTRAQLLTIIQYLQQ